jgi:hypothetical protein
VVTKYWLYVRDDKYVRSRFCSRGWRWISGSSMQRMALSNAVAAAARITNSWMPVPRSSIGLTVPLMLTLSSSAAESTSMCASGSPVTSTTKALMLSNFLRYSILFYLLTLGSAALKAERLDPRHLGLRTGSQVGRSSGVLRRNRPDEL